MPGKTKVGFVNSGSPSDDGCPSSSDGKPIHSPLAHISLGTTCGGPSFNLYDKVSPPRSPEPSPYHLQT